MRAVGLRGGGGAVTMPSPNRQDTPARDALAGLLAVFAARGIPSAPRARRAFDAALDHAETILAGCEGGDAGSVSYLAAELAGRLLAISCLAGEATQESRAELVDELIENGAGPLALLSGALRAPALQGADPGIAREQALALMSACGKLRSVTLFSRGGVGGLDCAAHHGTRRPSAEARSLARATLSGKPVGGGELLERSIVRAGEPVAAVVARPGHGGERLAAAALAQAEAPLAAMLERESLIASNEASERMLLAASERRLTRLGFDLHDGPLQELVVIGEDLELLRRQVAVVLEGRRGKELLGGRLDDVGAQLVALERGLRRISSSVHADVLVSRPFDEALLEVLDSFSARAGIEPKLELSGELDGITTSQRLAVLGVVGEALSNIREHAAATSVWVSISLDEDGLRARVRDDGRGFDVERELLRAARSGHMGLAGMHERVRLLDGSCRVESSPAGGSTEVTLTLPRWRAPQASAKGQARSRG